MARLAIMAKEGMELMRMGMMGKKKIKSDIRCVDYEGPGAKQQTLGHEKTTSSDLSRDHE